VTGPQTLPPQTSTTLLAKDPHNRPLHALANHFDGSYVLSNNFVGKFLQDSRYSLLLALANDLIRRVVSDGN
jgi:hypothetical protein